jgi:hypothetical protein
MTVEDLEDLLEQIGPVRSDGEIGDRQPRVSGAAPDRR